jgi:hypothetical protein
LYSTKIYFRCKLDLTVCIKVTTLSLKLLFLTFAEGFEKLEVFKVTWYSLKGSLKQRVGESRVSLLKPRGYCMYHPL